MTIGYGAQRMRYREDIIKRMQEQGTSQTSGTETREMDSLCRFHGVRPDYISWRLGGESGEAVMALDGRPPVLDSSRCRKMRWL